MLLSLGMFIASVSTQKTRESGNLGDIVERNLESAEISEVPTQLDGRSENSPKNAKSKKRKNQPPKWPKYPFYNQRQMGQDYFESKPKRRHTHTIVF